MSSFSLDVSSASSSLFPSFSRFRIPLFLLFTIATTSPVDGVDHAVHHVAVEVGATARFDCRTCPLAVNKLAVHNAVWSRRLNDSPTTKTISYGIKVDHSWRHKYGIKHRLRRDCGSNFDIVIRDVRLEDAGRYTCTVDLAQPRYLTVVERPVCTPQPAPLLSWENQTAGSTCDTYECIVVFEESEFRHREFQPLVEWRYDPESKTTSSKTANTTKQMSIHADGFRTKITLIHDVDPSAPCPVPRCVVSDAALNVHPASGKVRLHNADLGAVGRYMAARPTPSALFSLVSQSCERQSIRVECPDVVDIDDVQFTAQVVRMAERNMKAEIDGTYACIGPMGIRVPCPTPTFMPADTRGNSNDSTSYPDHHIKFINERQPSFITSFLLKKMIKHKLAIHCIVTGNPLPSLMFLHWEDFNGTTSIDQTLLDERRGHGVINAYYFPKRSDLRDHLDLTLKFWVDSLSHRPEDKKRENTEATIRIRWLYGPYLLCPQHIFLSDQGKGRDKRRKDYERSLDDDEGVTKEGDGEESSTGSFLIKCIVHVNPVLSVGDISWTLKPVSRERRKLVRVKPEASVFNETVKVVQVSSPSGDNFSLVDLVIMESWVRNRKCKRSSSKYLLDLTVEKNSRFATASIQIQWDCATRPSGFLSILLVVIATAMA